MHEGLQFTADHLLALTSENSVHANVEEPMKFVAFSVPQDPSMSPSPLFLKSLSEVVDSDRNVSFGNADCGGYSRRILAAPDGYNISVHNTLVQAQFSPHFHYQNNVEAVNFIKGQGENVGKMASNNTNSTLGPWCLWKRTRTGLRLALVMRLPFARFSHHSRGPSG